MLTHGKHLASVRTERSGVIPYSIKNGTVYFLIAKHRLSGEYGDFGGGVRKNEYALSGAFREFSEESLEILSNQYSSPNDLVDKIAMLDGHLMSMVFVPVHESLMNQIVNRFNSLVCEKDEISEIKWVDYSDFLMLINTSTRKKGDGHMWTKIRNFLRKIRFEELKDALSRRDNRCTR